MKVMALFPTLGEASLISPHKDVIHAAPVEIPEQGAKARLGAGQIDVMPEVGFQADILLPWLFGIDLPWMKIKYTGLPISMIYAPHEPAGKVIRQQSKITAAACREITSKQCHGGGRQFDHPTFTLWLEFEAWRMRHTVVVMPDRINTRTVEVARIQQLIQRPQVVVINGETGRPVADDGLPPQVFQQLFAACDVIPEFFWTLF